MANSMFLQLKNGTIQEGEKVKVKLSGDGARMSRVSNFILLSFSVLQSTDDLLSSKGKNNTMLTLYIIITVQ